MTRAEMEDLITDVLCQQKLLSADEITPATRLIEDLAMDSLDLAELFATIQQRTGRQLSAHSLADFDTVASLASSVMAGSVLAADAIQPVTTASCSVAEPWSGVESNARR